MSNLYDNWKESVITVYDSQEKSTLELLQDITSFNEEIAKGIDNLDSKIDNGLSEKTDLNGNHLGAWQGLSRPTLSDEGMRATVEGMKHTLDKINNGDIPSLSSQLEQKAIEITSNTNNISTLQSQIAGLASGSPKGTYATLSALTTAKPTGDNNIYIVTADGGWYYWSGSAWTKGGIYQATSFSIYKSILNNNENIDTLKSEGTYLIVKANVTGTLPFTTSPYLILEIQGTGNFITHTLTDIVVGAKKPLVYIRTWNNSWSDWSQINVETPNKNVIMTSGTSYNYTGITDVVFDEINKTITFPIYSCIVLGATMYQLPSEVVVNVENTLTMRTLILFNTITNTIYLKNIGGIGHTPSPNDVMLGSFMSEVIGGNHNYKHIQACFPYTLKQRTQPVTTIPSYYNGKKGNFIGDSTTKGVEGTYVTTVKDMLGLSVARNYGVGGRALCTRTTELDTQYPPIVNSYLDMDNDADVVFMMIGTNDYSSQVPLGAKTSTSKSEFYGGLNIVLDGLRDKYPDKLIIVASPISRYNPDQYPIKFSEYRNAIEEKCIEKNIIFYDAYKKSGLNFIKDYYAKITTCDGLHTSYVGSEILGRRIAGFINSN